MTDRCQIMATEVRSFPVDRCGGYEFGVERGQCFLVAGRQNGADFWLNVIADVVD